MFQNLSQQIAIAICHMTSNPTAVLSLAAVSVEAAAILTDSLQYVDQVINEDTLLISMAEVSLSGISNQ